MKQFVNFDFDLSFPLRSMNFNLKNQYDFEFIFFFLNDFGGNILCSKYSYDDSYLAQLMSYGLIIPKITNDFEEVKPWWGDFNNFDVKNKFISKYNLVETLSQTQLIPDFVEKVHPGKYSSNEKKYYRSEYGFSGIANKIIEANETVDLKNKGTVATYLDIDISFGITINLATNDYFICTNTISPNGNFLGGKLIDVNIIALKLEVAPRFVEMEIAKIASILKENGASGTIQFDSLLYKKEGKIFWYKVVEINYRKTMGLLIKKLNDIFGPGEYLISKNILNDAILLSPSKTKLKSYYKKFS